IFKGGGVIYHQLFQVVRGKGHGTGKRIVVGEHVYVPLITAGIGIKALPEVRVAFVFVVFLFQGHDEFLWVSCTFGLVKSTHVGGKTMVVGTEGDVVSTGLYPETLSRWNKITVPFAYVSGTGGIVHPEFIGCKGIVGTDACPGKKGRVWVSYEVHATIVGIGGNDLIT